MTNLGDIKYTRDRTIQAISNYYDFLVQMYMKDAQVIHPPTEGWPAIVNANPEVLQRLGKTDEVLSLLSHLPYIRNDRTWHRTADAAPNCLFADWNNLIARLHNPADAGTARILTEGPVFSEFSSPHAIGLTRGARGTPIIILDTKLGIVHWEEDSCPHSFKDKHYQISVDYHPAEEDQVSEEETAWRQSAAAWAIPEFFEALKAQFRDLYWLPISANTVTSGDEESPDEAGMSTMLTEVYHYNGWPDLTTYHKVECLTAVRELMHLRYPESVCIRDSL